MNIPFSIITTLVSGCFAVFCLMVILTLITDATMSSTIKKLSCKLFVQTNKKFPNDPQPINTPKNCFESSPKIISLPIICTIAFSFGILVETSSRKLPFIQPLERNARLNAYIDYLTYSGQPEKLELSEKSTILEDLTSDPKTHKPLAYNKATTAFFKASNAAKNEITYYQDIITHDIHINFTRSIIAISGTTGLVLFLLGCIKIIRIHKFTLSSSSNNIFETSYKRIFLAALSLEIITAFLMYSLYLDTEKRTHRALGYYNHLITKQPRQPTTDLVTYSCFPASCNQKIMSRSPLQVMVQTPDLPHLQMQGPIHNHQNNEQ